MNICSSCHKTICHNSPNDQNQSMLSTSNGTSVDHLGDKLDELFIDEEAETVTPAFTPPSEMNICSSSRKTTCPNSPNDQNQCMCSTNKGTSVDHRGDTLDELLVHEEVETVTPVCTLPLLDGDYMRHVGQKTTTVLGVHKSESTSVTHKCFLKFEKFPCGKLSSWSASSDEEEEAGCDMLADSYIECSNNVSRSISLPTPLELVSAMKGSREKQGLEPKKLSVTWDPNVYDPPPSSLSPVAKSRRQQRSKNKESGKNKQKAKASRGSIGKDKKQFQNISENSDICFKKPDAGDRLVDVADYVGELEDFDVESPDSYCGSSFLKKSLGKAPMPPADFIDY